MLQGDFELPSKAQQEEDVARKLAWRYSFMSPHNFRSALVLQPFFTQGSATLVLAAHCLHLHAHSLLLLATPNPVLGAPQTLHIVLSICSEFAYSHSSMLAAPSIKLLPHKRSSTCLYFAGVAVYLLPLQGGIAIFLLYT